MTTIDAAELRLRQAVWNLCRLDRELRNSRVLDAALRDAFHAAYREKNAAERELTRLQDPTGLAPDVEVFNGTAPHWP